jgi:amidophosphoribosyltransferase
VQLIREDGKEYLLDEAFEKCVAENNRPLEEVTNGMAWLYDLYSYDQISARIAKILTPKNLQIPVDIIFQSLEGLHQACPNHRGDWYFSGKYPTPGGNRVVNNAFINYMQKKEVRAY